MNGKQEANMDSVIWNLDKYTHLPLELTTEKKIDKIDKTNHNQYEKINFEKKD